MSIYQSKFKVSNQLLFKKTVILHIITGLYTGGAEIMLYNLLAKTNRQKYEPVVISLMDQGTLGEKIIQLGVPVYTLGLDFGKPSFQAIIKLIKLVKQIQPQLIQGWMYHGNFAAQSVKFLTGIKIPIIWGIHHSINSLASEKKLTQFLIKLGVITSSKVESIIFVSSQSKLQHEKLGYSPAKSVVIPNGFDLDLFQPSQTARICLRKELNLAADTIIIGSIARYHPMKDHANFLQAAALLLAKVPNVNVHFVLVGTGIDRNNQTLNNLINNLALKNQVHLLGERRDIQNITPGFDIMTSASAYGEAFPLVIGEAMSCGVPCVVTDVGDSAWLVGEIGKIVPPKDAQALANAWQELIGLSQSERKTLGQAARVKIQQLFSLEAIVSQYENLYEQAIAVK
jgi:glycosyltransferase involved in cell wall biosynthesis